MTDPAIEAATRALDNMPLLKESAAEQPVLAALVSDVGSAAAHEALAPLRELHRRDIIKATSCAGDGCAHEGDCPMDVEVLVCWECYRFASDEVYPYFGEENLHAVEWPCPTARLVYSSEELGEVPDVR